VKTFDTLVEIKASADGIVAVLFDVERWPKWTSTMTSVERLDDGSLAVGSRARIVQPKPGASPHPRRCQTRRLAPRFQAMADQAEPETPQGPAGGSTQAAASDAVAVPAPEVSAPMLDVHAPHETIHTWKDFLTHMAAIVAGLVIAVSASSWRRRC
jgi:hypothetical protein